MEARGREILRILGGCGSAPPRHCRRAVADPDPAAVVREAQEPRGHPKEATTNETSTLVDSDAANKASDADLSLQELGADYAGQSYVTATVTVWHPGPADRG